MSRSSEPGDGGGTDGPSGLEPRVMQLEATGEETHRELRERIRALERSAAPREAVDLLDDRMRVLEERLSGIEERLTEIESHLEEE